MEILPAASVLDGFLRSCLGVGQFDSSATGGDIVAFHSGLFWRWCGMSIYLDGVGAQFYRGIGPEAQLVGPFKKMNFFVGSNNSGKSIVLNLIAERIKAVGNNGVDYKLRPEERYSGTQSGEFVSFVASNQASVDHNLRAHQKRVETIQSLKTVVERLTVDGLLWTKTSDKSL